MKTFITLALTAGLLAGIASCTKDDGIKLQSHDENRMMDSLHAMMSRMQSMTPTNDPELDFPKMMIMHHQGAINMGNVQIQEGKDDSLKRFTKKWWRHNKVKSGNSLQLYPVRLLIIVYLLLLWNKWTI